MPSWVLDTENYLFFLDIAVSSLATLFKIDKNDKPYSSKKLIVNRRNQRTNNSKCIGAIFLFIYILFVHKKINA